MAVGNDRVIKKIKGFDRPILNEKTRVKTVDSLKIVDYTILEDTSPYNKEVYGKFVYNDLPIIEKLKPNKWVINDDVSGISTRKELAEKLGVELVILKSVIPREL